MGYGENYCLQKIENGVEVDEEFKSKYSQVVYFNAWENDIFDAPLQSLFLYYITSYLGIRNVVKNLL